MQCLAGLLSVDGSFLNSSEDNFDYEELGVIMTQRLGLDH